MPRRLIPLCLVALSLAACNPSGRSRVATTEPAPPAASVATANADEARTAASGFSFLRPSGADSYEVLYFDPSGKASLLRADQYQIAHGRWTAEVAPVGSSPDPVPAICVTLNSNRRCLDPKLLVAENTEKARGDILGIGRWQSVPEALPRERASFEDIRTRLRS